MEIIFEILFRLIEYYSYALIIYLLMSWFPNARETSIGRFLATICEPFLEPFRRIIPPIGMFDFSPIIAFLALRYATAGLREVAYWLIF
ncbi:YggT family protein [Bacillaceae bacterium Marseille-Q3522]|nr:YggT family protein [Bacillaceae bacterium Marseille-Q3522]